MIRFRTHCGHLKNYSHTSRRAEQNNKLVGVASATHKAINADLAIQEDAKSEGGHFEGDKNK